IKVRLPPENLIRAPFELGCSPVRSTSTPAFINSSLYFPMAARSSSLGILPASDSLFAFTIIMNRIFVSPAIKSNENPQNRQGGRKTSQAGPESPQPDELPQCPSARLEDAWQC